MPVIGLAEALMLGLLVPYDYRLHELRLDDDEMEQYEQLTKRIGLMVSQGASVNDANSPLQMLLIRRARILKQARGKVPTAAESSGRSTSLATAGLSTATTSLS